MMTDRSRSSNATSARSSGIRTRHRRDVASAPTFILLLAQKTAVGCLVRQLLHRQPPATHRRLAVDNQSLVHLDATAFEGGAISRFSFVRRSKPSETANEGDTPMAKLDEGG